MKAVAPLFSLLLAERFAVAFKRLPGKRMPRDQNEEEPRKSAPLRADGRSHSAVNGTAWYVSARGTGMARPRRVVRGERIG